MIKEAYCSIEVSKLLREKGFDESIFEFYVGGNKDNIQYAHNKDGFRPSELPDSYYPHITHQMAMAWLREYKIYIMIDRSWSMEDSWQYCICVNNDFDHLIQQDSIPNRTYEEAVEAALKHILENLI